MKALSLALLLAFPGLCFAQGIIPSNPVKPNGTTSVNLSTPTLLADNVATKSFPTNKVIVGHNGSGIGVLSSSNAPLYLGSGQTTGATAVGALFTFGNFTTAGSKAMSVTASAEKFAVWGPGGILVPPATLTTCGATGASEGTILVVAGAAAVRTKICACTLAPTGSVYAWVNLAWAGVAGGNVGNTTTCP